MEIYAVSEANCLNDPCAKEKVSPFPCQLFNGNASESSSHLPRLVRAWTSLDSSGRFGRCSHSLTLVSAHFQENPGSGNSFQWLTTDHDQRWEMELRWIVTLTASPSGWAPFATTARYGFQPICVSMSCSMRSIMVELSWLELWSYWWYIQTACTLQNELHLN